MLLGFKRRFAPYVEEGSKTHTIRAKRINLPKVGETCHCYVDPRQKTMRLLGRWPCSKVEPILIYVRGDGTLGIWLNGDVELSYSEQSALAWRDGFRSAGRRGALAEFTRFWIQVHKLDQLSRGFEGHLIHWRWNPSGKAAIA